MSVHVNAEYAHEMTAHERLGLRLSLVERIGWNKNSLRASSGLRRKFTRRTTTYYNTISWHCEGIRVLLVDFQQQNFAKLNISRCKLHHAPHMILNLYHNSVVFLLRMFNSLVA